MKVDNYGDIEVICQNEPGVNDTVKLVFRAVDDIGPPFQLRIRSPSGKLLIERVLRELPTGMPQSAPAITFLALSPGGYRIEIRQISGSAVGDGVLTVK